jgi:hypothetical protein
MPDRKPQRDQERQPERPPQGDPARPQESGLPERIQDPDRAGRERQISAPQDIVPPAQPKQAPRPARENQAIAPGRQGQKETQR